ncbi:MAG TPA: DUF6680 family protein [Bradyrhizobium sp.]|nr:DUF6680 family protein [Bradyrhizobium sp.]
MNIDTWAVVLATVAGPLAAVFITRWNDQRREARNRLLHIYRVLMATRRTAISEEHVAAINLIEVEFHGVKPVIEAWTTYLTHLNSPNPQGSTSAAAQTWEAKRNELLALLLVKIAAHLGITKGELEIMHGGYAPQGWATRDDRLAAIQDYAIRLSRAEAALPVSAVNQTPPNNPYPPAP